MDTSKLAVGQDLYMMHGRRFRVVKVTKVMPHGVEMKTSFGPMRFDTNGKACDCSGWELALKHPDDRDPWELYWRDAF